MIAKGPCGYNVCASARARKSLRPSRLDAKLACGVVKWYSVPCKVVSLLNLLEVIMPRKSLSRRKSRRIFRNGARRVHRLNNLDWSMRGGWSL